MTRLLEWVGRLPPDARYFAWQYFRALSWVILVALALRRASGNRKVARAFFLAHLAALGFGLAVDVFMVNWAPKAWLDIEFLQWVFVAPIAIFTVISLWICSWEAPVYAADAFMAMVPIVAWGLLVTHGWQPGIWHCHVLGAWFVSAASGGVDLYVRYGPPRVRRRRYEARLAGYAGVVLAVYLLLPTTETALFW